MSAHRGLRCLSAGSRGRIGNSSGAVSSCHGGGPVTHPGRSRVTADLQGLGETYFDLDNSIVKDFIICLNQTKTDASILKVRNSQKSQTSI